MEYCIWHALCGDLTWRGIYTCLGVRTTSLQRVSDVVKMSVYEHGGTLGELHGTKRMVMECYVQAQDARSWSLHVRWGDLGWFEWVTSGGFPSVLTWSWHFLNFKWLLWSMLEVSVRFPGVVGVLSCCCWLHRGGSGRQSEICELESWYGERQINFKRKSVVETWYTIRN